MNMLQFTKKTKVICMHSYSIKEISKNLHGISERSSNSSHRIYTHHGFTMKTLQANEVGGQYVSTWVTQPCMWLVQKQLQGSTSELACMNEVSLINLSNTTVLQHMDSSKAKAEQRATNAWVHNSTESCSNTSLSVLLYPGGYCGNFMN